MDLAYFQLIDRIIGIDIDARRITVEANVPEKSTVFEGHFPGFPLMPGVLLTEAMAQTSGWLLIALMKFERMPFLAAVREAKLRNFIKPGEKLIIEATLTHDGSGYAMTDARVLVNGQVKCNASLTFAHVPFPHPDLRSHMDAMATKLGFPREVITHG